MSSNQNWMVPQEVSNFSNGNFWVVYGKNGTGKTHFIGTFPNLLIVCFSDAGLNTVKNLPGVKYIMVPPDATPEDIIQMCKAYKDSPFESIAFDTFGVFQDRVKEMIKDTLKKKKMEIQMWGDLGEYMINCLKAMKELSINKNVIVSFYEDTEEADGYENEIPTHVSVATVGNMISKYLCGIANYAIHTFIYDYMDANMKHTYYHACHVGVNPYYWTKFQTDKQVPEVVFNPSYEELIKYKN